MQKITIRTLRAMGFLLSKRTGKGRYSVRCDSCEAATINGFPCHERGCWRIVREMAE